MMYFGSCNLFSDAHSLVLIGTSTLLVHLPLDLDNMFEVVSIKGSKIKYVKNYKNFEKHQGKKERFNSGIL